MSQHTDIPPAPSPDPLTHMLQQAEQLAADRPARAWLLRLLRHHDGAAAEQTQTRAGLAGYKDD
jgi:hypothetical protein